MLDVRPRAAFEGRRRAVVIGLAALPVLAVLGVVALLPRGPDVPPAQAGATGPGGTSAAAVDVPRPSPSGSASGSPSGSASGGSAGLLSGGGGAALFGAGPVAEGDLPRLLDGAGLQVPDGAVSAWSWKDADGVGLLLVSLEPDRTDEVARSVTVRFLVVADVGGRNRVLARLRDGGPRCRSGRPMNAAITPGSVRVRDDDGDGRAEVTLGWTHRCGATSNPTRVRLEVVTPAGAFLLPATGVLGGTDGPLTPTPDPDGTDWPPGLLTRTAQLFASLYR